MILLTALAAVLVIAAPGCMTTDPATGKRVPDTNANAQVVGTLQPTVSELVREAARRQPNSAQYLDAIANVFCKMEANKQFNPGYLLAEVDRVGTPKIPADEYPWAITAKNAVLALYQIRWAQAASANVSPEEWGGVLARIFCTGIKTGLKDAGIPVTGVPALSEKDLQLALKYRL